MTHASHARSSESYDLGDFFERAHTQNLAGQAGAGCFTVMLSWNYADHGRLLFYLTVQLLLVAVMGLAFFGKLGSRRTRDGIPTMALPALVVAQTWSASVLLLDFGSAGDIRFVLAAMVVQYACAAGTMVTLGPVRRLSRAALFCLLTPGTIAAMLHGHWILCAGTAFFVVVVAVVGAEQMHQSFAELASLRASAAGQAEVDRLRANTDDLTQLHNRRGMRSRFESEPDAFGAMIYLDLDHFKLINDTAGHLAGDELLVQVGKRIVREVGEGAVVARMGGDEFLVLIPAGETDVDALASRIEERVVEPYALSCGTWSVGASTGSTRFEDGDSFSATLHKADKAMFRAKARNRLRESSAAAENSRPGTHSGNGLRGLVPMSMDR